MSPFQLLSELDQRMATSLINQVAGAQELPRDVVARIMADADGVPLFIEELTKTVLQKGLTYSDGERISDKEPLSPDAVPTSLHASLMERLDRLPAGKEVVQIGAVIGREFSFEMLQALSPLAGVFLEHALGELVQAGIIVAHGQPPSATYVFKHALLQDAAYASMLRDLRRAIHLRLAEELEKDTAEVGPVPRAYCLAFLRRLAHQIGRLPTIWKLRSARPVASRWPKWSASFATGSARSNFFLVHRKRSDESLPCSWRSGER